MKSSISHQAKEHFPELFSQDSDNDDGDFSVYKRLYHLGVYCSENFQNDKGREVLKTVNMWYGTGNVFDNNAIENEFFLAIAERQNLESIMETLKEIPEQLWEVYIKVLLETQKK